MEHVYGLLKTLTKEYLRNNLIHYNYKYVTHGCFGIMGHYFERGKDFCFGFEIDEGVADKFIKDFNEKFENIKLEKAFSLKYYRYINPRFKHMEIAVDENPERKLYKVSGNSFGTEWTNKNAVTDFVMFTCKFNPDYDWKVQFAFYPIVGELIRIFATWGEFFLENEYCAELAKNYEGNLLEYAWTIDQYHLSNCIYDSADIKYLYKFDDIDFINDVFEQIEDRMIITSNYYGDERVNFSCIENLGLMYPTLSICAVKQLSK